MKTASRVNPAVFVSAALAIAVYFFYFTGGGLHTGFSHDDLMNLWRAWQDPLPHILKENLFFFLYPINYRPLGTLFYHVFFDAFGLTPLPYRLCLLALLLANIYLVYAFARRISQSREIGAVTALLHGFHVSFAPIYRNTGTCYDVICGFFYLSALVWYLRIRQQDRLLRPVEQIGILALLICALDAKEMAVTLPVLMGVYEALYHPPPGYKPRVLISWLVREGRVACWGAIIDLAFIIGKVYGTDGIGQIGGRYKPSFTLIAFMHGIRHDMEEVFIAWDTNVFRERNVAILLLLLFLFAWRSRLVHFRFALLFWLIGVLPVAFVPSRSIYAVYIPLAGFDLCAAILFIETREWLWRGVRRLTHLPDRLELRQVLTFIVLLLALSQIYYVKGAKLESWHNQQSRQIGSVIDALRTQLPTPKKGAHMLFLKDPFEKHLGADLATVFITHLLYRDTSIQADRLWQMPNPPDAAHMQQYDYIFTMDRTGGGDKLVMLAPP